MTKADFLVLHYQCLDILFTRDLFYASTYRNICDPASHASGSRVMFGDRPIPDFDLDSYVRSLFPEATGAPPLLGAVCRVDVVFVGDDKDSPEARRISEVSDLISLAIPSDSGIRSYPLSDFRLLPFNIRKGLDQHGIRALRFEGPKPQYFCDACIFIPDCCRSWKRRPSNVWYFRDARVFSPAEATVRIPRSVR